MYNHPLCKTYISTNVTYFTLLCDCNTVSVFLILQELLATFVRRTGVTVERMWSPRVTHLICGTDETGAARRTFKYLMANLEGKWILKVDCMFFCHFILATLQRNQRVES